MALRCQFASFLIASMLAVGCSDKASPGGGSPAEPENLDSAALSLTYADNSPVYVVGFAINPNYPSLQGGFADNYSITPESLPDGLTFDAGTGVFSGTPIVAAPTQTYFVTASNAIGSASTSLSITVIDQSEPSSTPVTPVSQDPADS